MAPYEWAWACLLSNSASRGEIVCAVHCAAIRLIKSYKPAGPPRAGCPPLSILYLSGGETITIGEEEEQRGIPPEQDNNIANRC